MFFFLDDVEGFTISDNMLDVIKECYKFRFEVEESYVHIEHIYNCMRMLLTLYFFIKISFFKLSNKIV